MKSGASSCLTKSLKCSRACSSTSTRATTIRGLSRTSGATLGYSKPPPKEAAPPFKTLSTVPGPSPVEALSSAHPLEEGKGEAAEVSLRPSSIPPSAMSSCATRLYTAPRTGMALTSSRDLLSASRVSRAELRSAPSCAVPDMHTQTRRTQTRACVHTISPLSSAADVPSNAAAPCSVRWKLAASCSLICLWRCATTLMTLWSRGT